MIPNAASGRAPLGDEAIGAPPIGAGANTVLTGAFACFDPSGGTALFLWRRTIDGQTASNLCTIQTCPFMLKAAVTGGSAGPISGDGAVLGAVTAFGPASGAGGAPAKTSGSVVALVGAAPLERRRVSIWTCLGGAQVWRNLGYLDYERDVTAVRLDGRHLAVEVPNTVFVYYIDESPSRPETGSGPAPESLSRPLVDPAPIRLRGAWDSSASGTRPVLALSSTPARTLVAYPGPIGGKVHLEIQQNEPVFAAAPSRADAGARPGHAPLATWKRLIIDAHDSAVAHVAFSRDGSLLATASEKGTVLRVFETVSGSFLAAYRRGSSPAEIHSLAFSPPIGLAKSIYLVATSNSGTAHLYEMEALPTVPVVGDRKAGSWRWRSYMAAETSASTFRLPESQTVASFSASGDLFLMSYEGIFYRFLGVGRDSTMTPAEVQAVV